jgi:hypothetical protein
LRMALIENENRIRQAVKQISRAIGSELRAFTNAVSVSPGPRVDVNE